MDVPSKKQKSYSFLEKEGERSRELGTSRDALTSAERQPSVITKILKWRNYLILILTPLLFSPLPIVVPTPVSLLMI